MKNWKKYLALLTALLLVVAFAACTPAQEPTEPSEEQSEAPTETPTEEPTEAPTEETTEAPTEPEADYSGYMGNWYSGSVTFTVNEERKWVMQENGETFMTGHFIVNENGTLTLYDVEGVEVANMLLEEEGSIYAELYVEEMYSRVEDFTFLRTASSDDVIGEIEDPGIEEGVEEEAAPEVGE